MWAKPKADAKAPSPGCLLGQQQKDINGMEGEGGGAKHGGRRKEPVFIEHFLYAARELVTHNHSFLQPRSHLAGLVLPYRDAETEA